MDDDRNFPGNRLVEIFTTIDRGRRAPQYRVKCYSGKFFAPRKRRIRIFVRPPMAFRIEEAVDMRRESFLGQNTSANDKDRFEKNSIMEKRLR